MWEEIQVKELIQHCQFSFKIKRHKTTSIVKRETYYRKKLTLWERIEKIFLRPKLRNLSKYWK